MLTQTISETECIGDSILKINSNFVALDDKLRSIPSLAPGNGTEVSYDSSRGERHTVSVDITNFSVYETTFNGNQGVISDKLILGDDTTVNTYRFPYVSLQASKKPFGSFTLTSNNNKPAKVTLYWTGEGQNNLTVFATNSSVSYQTGETFFNDGVTGLYRDGQKLYVGGKFTQCGGETRNKLAVLDLGDNIYYPETNLGLGFKSTLLTDPLSTLAGDLGTNGSVNAIVVVEQTLQTLDESTNLGDTVKILFVGGSFNGAYKGRGLCAVILDSADPDSSYFPFYVNGEVYSMKVVDGQLLIGGDFDYISYGVDDPPVGSDRRIYTNGLAKIQINQINNPYCIDTDFTESVLSLFDGPAVVYAIEYGTWLDPITINQIFIGGSFKIARSGEVLAQNVAAINSDALFLTHWNPVLDGPVYTLSFSDIRHTSPLQAFLYAGGNFNKFVDKASVVKTPIERQNAICFIVDYPSESFAYPMGVAETWKPSFNGPVTTIITDGYGDYGYPAASQDYVYCYGHFTAIDGFYTTYLGAITKASHLISPGVVAANWRPRLDAKPELFSNALYRYDTSLIVGGNFNVTNQKIRHKLARISRVDQELNPEVVEKTVGWELGVQQIVPGTPLAFGTLTEKVTAYSYAEPTGNITATAFPSILIDATKHQPGMPYRFYIKRLGNSGYWDDGLKNDSVQVIGWTVDFK